MLFRPAVFRSLAARLATFSTPAHFVQLRALSSQSVRVALPITSQVGLFQRRWASEDARIEREEAAEQVQEIAESPASEASAIRQTTSSPPTTSSSFSTPSPEPRSDGRETVPGTVYIGNLFFDATVQDIEALFNRVAPIKSATIVKDSRGLSKGFGYVEFEGPDAAQHVEKAIQDLNLALFQGRRVTVQSALGPRRGGASSPFEPRSPNQVAKNPPSRTLFVGNIPYTLTDKELHDIFNGLEGIIDVRVAIDQRTGQPRGFAHADFVDVDRAVAAMPELEKVTMYGRKFRLDFGIPSRARRGVVNGEPSASPL